MPPSEDSGLRQIRRASVVTVGPRAQAAAIQADIDLDERGQPQTRVLSSRFERCETRFGVDAHRSRADPAQSRETGKLPRPDAPIWWLEYRRPCSTPGSRLPQPCGRIADGSTRHPQASDNRRLVCLGVRAKFHPGLTH
jgi:hypothetical protein